MQRLEWPTITIFCRNSFRCFVVTDGRTDEYELRYGRLLGIFLSNKRMQVCATIVECGAHLRILMYYGHTHFGV